MYPVFSCILGILIPFMGTSLGSSLVFFLKKDLNKTVEKIIIGFAAGVMVAASIWSLIIPAIEMAYGSYKLVWFPALIGLISGVFFLILVNNLTNLIEAKQKINMLAFAITLHNIPEGMAVGVCFAAFLAKTSGVLLIEALILAIGIAIQNIPEGTIIAFPLKMQGISKFKAFMAGVLSGIVEPIAAFITVLLVNFVIPILPYLLSFAAGAMMYVVVYELIPEMNGERKNSFGVIGFTFGFAIMMVLDIALG